MSDDITAWLQRLHEGDERSQQEIWNAYFQRLVSLARTKLAGNKERAYDEEDAALSAFNSFFRAVQEQRLPKLEDRLDLWKVLVVITARKISDQRKRTMARKRGSGNVRSESVFQGDSETARAGIELALGKEPTPEVAAQVAESFDRLMDRLPDATLRRIAQLKLESYSNREISEIIGCVERTIERKLERIRAIWIEDPTVQS